MTVRTPEESLEESKQQLQQKVHGRRSTHLRRLLLPTFPFNLLKCPVLSFSMSLPAAQARSASSTTFVRRRRSVSCSRSVVSSFEALSRAKDGMEER